MVFTVFTGSVDLAFRSHCDFEGLVEQSIVFTVFSKAQSSRFLRSQCDFEGLVEQSIVFTVFSKAQSSWLFKVTAILKV